MDEKNWTIKHLRTLDRGYTLTVAHKRIFFYKFYLPSPKQQQFWSIINANGRFFRCVYYKC